MSVPEPVELAEQGQVLRQRLQTQRVKIAALLAPADRLNAVYPRSYTMRLLTRQPALTAQLLTQVATLLLGARLIRTLNTAVLVARALRALAIQRQQRLLREKPTTRLDQHHR